MVKNIIKILKDGFLIICIVVLFLICLEFSLRLLYPDNMFSSSDKIIYQFDNNLLVKLKPHLNIVNADKVFQTDKDGFRVNPEGRVNADVKVVVYGDSNVMSRNLNAGQTFVAQLEEILNEQGSRSVKVINAGVSGYGPDQYLIRFKREADRIKPDIVIFNVFASNDYGDIIRNKLVRINDRGKLDSVSDPVLIEESLSSRQDFQRWIKSLWMIKVFLKEKQKKEKQKKEEKNKNKINDTTSEDSQNRVLGALIELDRQYKMYKERGSARYSNFADRYDMDIALFPDSDIARYKKRLMALILKNANDFAKLKGIRFIVSIQPASVDLVNTGEIPLEEMQNYAYYKSTNLSDPIKEFCIKSRINYVNLFDVYKANNPEELYIKNDTHWNVKGQRLAAESVGRYVLDNNLLQSSKMK